MVPTNPFLKKLTFSFNSSITCNSKLLTKPEFNKQRCIEKNETKEITTEIAQVDIQDLIDDETNQIIAIFEEEYPELSSEFQDIQDEMYEMFARKHMDYGLNNIALGGDILNNEDDKKSKKLIGRTI